jgi:hypothetical protein
MVWILKKIEDQDYVSSWTGFYKLSPENKSYVSVVGPSERRLYHLNSRYNDEPQSLVEKYTVITYDDVCYSEEIAMAQALVTMMGRFHVQLNFARAMASTWQAQCSRTCGPRAVSSGKMRLPMS